MPEMTFTVQWPDGERQACYSPSLVMHDHLISGNSYTIQEFVSRVETALDEASSRVQRKYGFACTSAAAQKHEIQVKARQFDSTSVPEGDELQATGFVKVLSMNPSLPAMNFTQGVSS